MTTADIFRGQLAFAYLPAGLLLVTFGLPWLRSMGHVRAQQVIATFHSFRFVGLAFIVPGVVGSSLPTAFAVPAAYGDLATSLLAIGALFAVRFRPLFWSFVVAFNVVGIYDLTSAYVHGNAFGLAPAAGQLGAAYFIPIVYVPLLMLTHFAAFSLMVHNRRRPAEQRPSAFTTASPLATIRAKGDAG
jgi:hypothetical protein